MNAASASAARAAQEPQDPPEAPETNTPERLGRAVAEAALARSTREAAVAAVERDLGAARAAESAARMAFLITARNCVDETTPWRAFRLDDGSVLVIVRGMGQHGVEYRRVEIESFDTLNREYLDRNS